MLRLRQDLIKQVEDLKINFKFNLTILQFNYEYSPNMISLMILNEKI